MDYATLSLIEIEVLEEDFNKEFFRLDEYNKSSSWKLLNNFTIESTDDGKLIKVTNDFKLPHSHFPEIILIAIKTCSKFIVKGEIGIKAKIECMGMLMQIGLFNLQGYYMAKAEGTDFAKAMPPSVDYKTVQNNYKYRLEDEWK